jgi:hypothetical protein
MSASNNQNQFLVSQQTEAEGDSFLMECFYDSGFIDKLRDNRLSIVAGRKGTGKTALARYLQVKYSGLEGRPFMNGPNPIQYSKGM